MNTISLKRICAAIAMLAMSSLNGAAHAQYVWLNEKGVKQYSDMPPPSSVPKNRILKEAGMATRAASPAPAEAATAGSETSAPDAASATARDKGPMTTAERNADFQKRKMEQAEKEKKAAEQEKRAADKARNCEQARSYNQSLQSGERLTRTDKNGERYYLNDEQRAQEARDTKRILNECK